MPRWSLIMLVFAAVIVGAALLAAVVLTVKAGSMSTHTYVSTNNWVNDSAPDVYVTVRNGVVTSNALHGFVLDSRGVVGPSGGVVGRTTDNGFELTNVAGGRSITYTITSDVPPADTVPVGIAAWNGTYASSTGTTTLHNGYLTLSSGYVMFVFTSAASQGTYHTRFGASGPFVTALSPAYCAQRSISNCPSGGLFVGHGTSGSGFVLTPTS